MCTRQEIIEEARSYVGCPFHHQGRIRAGIDCIGLVVNVGNALGSPIKDYTQYGRRPQKHILLEKLSESADQISIDDREDGDILIFWVDKRGWPQHVGIQTDKGMVHTYADIGKVVETNIQDFWVDRLMAVFRYRGVE